MAKPKNGAGRGCCTVKTVGEPGVDPAPKSVSRLAPPTMASRPDRHPRQRTHGPSGRPPLPILAAFRPRLGLSGRPSPSRTSPAVVSNFLLLAPLRLAPPAPLLSSPSRASASNPNMMSVLRPTGRRSPPPPPLLAPFLRRHAPRVVGHGDAAEQRQRQPLARPRVGEAAARNAVHTHVSHGTRGGALHTHVSNSTRKQHHAQPVDITSPHMCIFTRARARVRGRMRVCVRHSKAWKGRPADNNSALQQ
jgi:hypothetical protein